MTNNIRRDGSHRWENTELLYKRINDAEKAERAERQAQESATKWQTKAESAEEAALISRIDRASYGDSVNKRVQQARADFEREQKISERLQAKFNPNRGQSVEDFEEELGKWNRQAQQIIENTR